MPQGTPKPPVRPALPKSRYENPSGLPEYQVGGQTFTRINQETPVWFEKLMTKIGVAKARTASGDARHRIYRQVVAQRRKDPITERDFTPEELHDLDIAVRAARNRGAKELTQRDYFGSAWQGVTGKAQFEDLPDGSTVVRDTYDFNNYEQSADRSKVGGIKGTAGATSALETAVGANSTYWAAWLGRRAVPSGVRGVPVEIHINDAAQDLQDALARERDRYKKGGR